VHARLREFKDEGLNIRIQEVVQGDRGIRNVLNIDHWYERLICSCISYIDIEIRLQMILMHN
jgi:hypothetical protein